MADLQGWSRGTWGEGEFGEFIPVSVTGVSATISLPNITDGLTLSNTYQSLTNLGATPNANQDVVFQSDSNGILLKTSYTDAEIWWEAGGEVIGSWLGIAKIFNDFYIRFRSGSGASNQQTTGGGTAGGSNSRAVVNLSVSDSSVARYFDDERHIITWAIEVPNATYLAGRLRVWIDGNEVITYDPYNDDGSVLKNGLWAGTNPFGYGQGYEQVAGDHDTYNDGATRFQSFIGTSVGSDVFLNAYENQTISQLPIVVNGSALVTPTGVSSGVVLGTATGEVESIYPLTGVQSNTATGTLEAQEGHGVIVTGVEMAFADGTEEIITTVDAGWGRNTWGSFAWGENITIFANLVGQQLSTDIGTVITQTGTGVDAPVTGNSVATTLGAVSLVTDQVISVTGFNINALLQNPTILADGNVTTSAPGDQMDFAIGAVNIDIFTQVDVTAVTSTFETGTLGMSGDANFSLTGSQANTNVGTVTTVTGTGVNVATTGVSIQFAEGTETISGSAIVTPTGVEMSVVLGNMRSTPWANVVPGVSDTWVSVNTNVTNTWTEVAA